MSLPVKVATLSLIVTSLSSFVQDAGAAPLSASLALRDAVAPAFETVWWSPGGYYAYGSDYYCPPYNSPYSPTYYGYNAPRYYGGSGYGYGYGYGSYYRPYGYAPYGGYGYGY
jgi:hypothetical protein